MLLVLLFMATVPVIGGYFLLRGKVRTMGRLQAKVDADVRNRLSSVAYQVGGTVYDGRTLGTPRGKMTLVASKAPESFVVDLAKFAGKTALVGAMTVVRHEDAKKVIATKNMRVHASKDAIVAERYHVLVSDEEEGHRWVTAKLAESIRALETAVRARCRLQVSNETATILAFRGLTTAEELKAFYDGSIGVMDVLEASVRPKA